MDRTSYARTWSSLLLQAAAQIRGIHLALGSDMAMEINVDPGYSRNMGTVMALHGSPGLNVTMASGDSTGHSDQHGPLRHHRSQTST